MQPVSPALSFGIDLDGDGGDPGGGGDAFLWVRVERLSYAEANLEDGRSAVCSELARADGPGTGRDGIEAGAIDIDLPGTQLLTVDPDGEVHINPILSLPSRRMVEEAMILTGEAAAGVCGGSGEFHWRSARRKPGESRVPHTTLAGMFAMRRLMRRSRYRVTPGGRAGLGLPHYAQVTSPNWRRPGPDGAPAATCCPGRGSRCWMKERCLSASAWSKRHYPPCGRPKWLLRSTGPWYIYCAARAGADQAVLVERRGTQGTLLIPDLALEARASLSGLLDLDSLVTVEIRSVDLPGLEFNIKTVT